MFGFLKKIYKKNYFVGRNVFNANLYKLLQKEFEFNSLLEKNNIACFKNKFIENALFEDTEESNAELFS